MLTDTIRRLGISDSAAAETVGMSATTVARWKLLYPELALKLKQARQQCCNYHLEKIHQHAEAENDRGLRASQWILERVYPAEFARKISERSEALNHEEVLRIREETAAHREEMREAEAERKAQAARAPDVELHHGRDSSPSGRADAAGADEAAGADSPVDPRVARPQTLTTTHATQAVPGRVGVPPADPGVPPGSPNIGPGCHREESARSSELPGGTPDRAGGTPTLPGAGGRCAPRGGSGHGVGSPESTRDASEGALHNCRNSHAAVAAERTPSHAVPAPDRSAASESDYHNLQNSPVHRLSANARGAARYLRENAARFAGVLDDLPWNGESVAAGAIAPVVPRADHPQTLPKAHGFLGDAQTGGAV